MTGRPLGDTASRLRAGVAYAVVAAGLVSCGTCGPNGLHVGPTWEEIMGGPDEPVVIQGEGPSSPGMARGNVAIVHAFTTEHDEHLAIMEYFDGARRDLGGRIVVIAVAADTVHDGGSRDRVADFVDEVEIATTVVWDPRHELLRAAAVQVVPACAVLDPEGRVSLMKAPCEATDVYEVKQHAARLLGVE